MSKSEDAFLELISSQKTGVFQWGIYVVIMSLSILESIGMMSILYVSKDVKIEFELNSIQLGFFLGMVFLGIFIGYFVVSPLANKIGYKVIVISCSTCFAICAYSFSFVESYFEVLILEFLCGLFIGGMSTNKLRLATEFTTPKYSLLLPAMILITWQLGGVLIGYLSLYVIPIYGWRNLFEIVGFMALFIVPFLVILLPESLRFLMAKGTKKALYRFNKTLIMMGIPKVSKFPEATNKTTVFTFIKTLRSNQDRRLILVLWISFFLILGVGYSFMGWVSEFFGDSKMSGTDYLLAFKWGSFVGVFLSVALASKFQLRSIIVWCFLSLTLLLLLWFVSWGIVSKLIIVALIGMVLHMCELLIYVVLTENYTQSNASVALEIAIEIGCLSAFLFSLLIGLVVTLGLSTGEILVLFSVFSMFLSVFFYTIRFKSKK